MNESFANMVDRFGVLAEELRPYVQQLIEDGHLDEAKAADAFISTILNAVHRYHQEEECGSRSDLL